LNQLLHEKIHDRKSPSCHLDMGQAASDAPPPEYSANERRYNRELFPSTSKPARLDASNIEQAMRGVNLLDLAQNIWDLEPPEATLEGQLFFLETLQLAIKAALKNPKVGQQCIPGSSSLSRPRSSPSTAPKSGSPTHGTHMLLLTAWLWLRNSRKLQPT
jgi:hypothetical protein